MPFVHNRQKFFSLIRNILIFKFKFQSFLIYRFKKAIAQLIMNFKTSLQNFFRFFFINEYRFFILHIFQFKVILSHGFEMTNVISF